MKRIAIILQAGPGSHESHARMFHAMVYARELVEHGHATRLIFDGAATQWLARWGAPADDDDRRMAAFFSGLKDAGVAYVVCDFCAGAFHVRDTLAALSEPLIGEYMDHPSIARLIEEGYDLLVL